MAFTDDARATSPCIDRCTMDDATGLCVGCLRTLDEILNWRAMGGAARRLVLAGLEARRPGRVATPADAG